jgi:hypothetical protein
MKVARLAVALIALGLASAEAQPFEATRPAPTAEALAAAEPLYRPPYTARPTPQDHQRISRMLVTRANGREYDMQFALDCLVEEDGGLACATADSPAPPADRLELVLRLITRFRIAPMTETNETTVGRRIRLVIRMGVERR